MLPDDVYALTGAGDPRLSPDGRTIAYVVWGADPEANAYRSAICLVEADGSAPPRQLTSGEKEDAAPRWSPDGAQRVRRAAREPAAVGLSVLAGASVIALASH